MRCAAVGLAFIMQIAFVWCAIAVRIELDSRYQLLRFGPATLLPSV